MVSRGRGKGKREGGRREGGREGGCEQRVKKEGVVGSEGGEGVKEGEGVVGRTYCIQLKNNDIIVVVDDLRRTDATLGKVYDTCVIHLYRLCHSMCIFPILISLPFHSP
jgi:hypothetical protein